MFKNINYLNLNYFNIILKIKILFKKIINYIIKKLFNLYYFNLYNIIKYIFKIVKIFFIFKNNI